MLKRSNGARLLLFEYVVEPRVHRILAAIFARPAHGELSLRRCLLHHRHPALDDVLVYRSSSLFSHRDQHQLLQGSGPLQEEGEQLQLEPRPSEIHQLDEAQVVKDEVDVVNLDT